MPPRRNTTLKNVAKVRVSRPRNRLYQEPLPGGRLAAAKAGIGGHSKTPQRLSSSAPVKISRTRRRLYQSDSVEPGAVPPRPHAPEPPLSSAAGEAGKQPAALAAVRRYMLAAAGIGALPFPLLDLAALSVLQTRLLRSLSRLYGIEYSEQRAKIYISALVVSMVPASLTLTLGSLIQAIPGLGSLAGLLLMPAAAAGSTYALGKVFIQHFELGGTLLDFDPQKVRAYFEEQYRQGQEIASDLATPD